MRLETKPIQNEIKQTKKLIIIKLCLHNSNYHSHCLIAKKRKETEEKLALVMYELQG